MDDFLKDKYIKEYARVLVGVFDHTDSERYKLCFEQV